MDQRQAGSRLALRPPPVLALAAPHRALSSLLSAVLSVLKRAASRSRQFNPATLLTLHPSHLQLNSTQLDSSRCDHDAAHTLLSVLAAVLSHRRSRPHRLKQPRRWIRVDHDDISTRPLMLLRLGGQGWREGRLLLCCEW